MIGKALGVVSLPLTVAHEATHAILLWPWTERYGWDVSLSASNGAAWYVDLVDDIPRWAAILGFLGPTIIGTMLATAVSIAWVLTGFAELPETVVGWAKLSLALVAWGMYAAPSPADVKGALE